VKVPTVMIGLGVIARALGVLAIAAASTVSSVTAQQQGSSRSVLETFDLRASAAVQQKLPRVLQEVSGLAVSGDGRVFAHGDERGVIVQLDACVGTVAKAFSLGKPAIAADFEGIVIVGQRFFLITSAGVLFETTEGADGAVMPFTAIETGFGKSCEVEGLSFDPADRTLLVGCKTPLVRALRDRVTLLRWSLDRRAPATSPQLSIPLADVVAATREKGFHPAAVERDPRTGHYLIVAGRQRQLVEVTPQGKVVASRALDRRRHAQPEGLALLGDSVLVVADEGGTGRATTTCYRRLVR
jgi:uncharacterized protein YjiK